MKQLALPILAEVVCKDFDLVIILQNNS